MSRTSDKMVSGRDLDQPLAQADDNDLTSPDSSSEHTDGFVTAISSPAETGSEEDQEVAFRLRSWSHTQEYAFKTDHSFISPCMQIHLSHSNYTSFRTCYIVIKLVKNT